MKKTELSEILLKVKKIYGDRFLIEQGTLDAWYEFIGDLDFSIAKAATSRYVRENEYAPTVAGIMKHYNAIVEEHNEVMARLKENYDRITGLYPGGHTKQAWQAYMSLVSSAKDDPGKQKISDMIASHVSAYISKAEGNVPTLAEYIGGLKSVTGGNGGSECAPD